MAGMDRRKFVAGSAAALGCACGGSGCKMITGVGDTPEIAAGAYMIEGGKVRITLDQVAELSRVGGSIKITDPKLKEPLIVVRSGDSDYRAASLKCTHGGREIEYRPQDGKFRCVSFGHSEFGLDGSLIKGPAEKPIRAYPASTGILKRNILTVTLD